MIGSRTYTHKLIGPPETIMPLLCPVREADWIRGWDPLLVVSASGVVERDCAFVTASLPSNAIWYVTRHEPGHGFVEKIKLTPGVTACRLTILPEFMRGWEARLNRYLRHGIARPETEA